MQNRRKEINTENKELKILYNLITKLKVIPGGILLKKEQNCHTKQTATQIYRIRS